MHNAIAARAAGGLSNRLNRTVAPEAEARKMCGLPSLPATAPMIASIRLRVLAATAALTLLAAVHAAPVTDPAYAEELAKWRARSDASLTRERGWLSIVSRDELSPGTYRIGAAPDNQIVLPKGLAPAQLGTIVVADLDTPRTAPATARGSGLGASDADLRIRIPMRQTMRSLNVAVAASLVLGEALRQTGGLGN